MVFFYTVHVNLWFQLNVSVCVFSIFEIKFTGSESCHKTTRDADVFPVSGKSAVNADLNTNTLTIRLSFNANSAGTR